MKPLAGFSIDQPGSFGKERVVAVAIALGLAWGALPTTTPSAEAAFRGRNGRIAFQAFMGAQSTPVVDADIFTVQPNGAGLQQITTGTELDCWPEWSPNGTSIAFVRTSLWAARVEAPRDVFVATDQGITNLTNTPTATELAPSWSPDGKQMVISSDRGGLPGSAHDLYVIDVDTGSARLLVQAPGEQSDPAWSPDGRWIAYLDDFRVMRLVSPDGSRTRSLSRTRRAGTLEFPDWSPDGTQIAFSAIKSFEGGAPSADIWVVDSAGTRLTKLTKNPADDFGPSWSPEGKEIAFLSQRGDFRKLYTMRADGSHARPVIDIEIGAAGCPPSWGPRP